MLNGEECINPFCFSISNVWQAPIFQFYSAKKFKKITPLKPQFSEKYFMYFSHLGDALSRISLNKMKCNWSKGNILFPWRENIFWNRASVTRFHHQCDQIARLLHQYLALHSNQNLANGCMFGLFPTYGSSPLSDHPCLHKELHSKEKAWSNETILYWKHKTRGKTLTCYKMLAGCHGG